MNHLYFLLDSIMDTAIFIVILIFLNAEYKPKGGKWLLRLPLVASYAVQSALYLVLFYSRETVPPPAVIDFFSWVCRLIIIISVYEGNPVRNLAIHALYSLSSIPARLLIFQLLSLRQPIPVDLSFGSTYMNVFITALLSYMLLSSGFIVLMRKLFLPRLESITLSWSLTLLCSAINVSNFILVPIITSYEAKVSPDTAGILLIAMIIAVAAVIITTLVATHEISKRRQVLDQNAMLQSQLEMQYQHFIEMEKSDAELHKLRHDIANHMLILQDMLGDGTGAPAEYVQKLTEKYENATTAMICRNFIFNAVLCRQRDICQQSGIEFHFQIDVPPTLEISDIDLMGVLSNLLSNAVNASLAVPESRRRYVYLSSRLNAGVLAIAIENSCCLPGEEQKPAQEDGHAHGWGIKIIKEAVEKYDGVFKLKIIKDKAFTSATMVNKKV